MTFTISASLEIAFARFACVSSAGITVTAGACTIFSIGVGET